MLRGEIIGNLGNDAVVKEFSGKKYVVFSVANTEHRKGPSGIDVSETSWISVYWYGEGGKVMPYLKAGTKVFVRGRLSARLYQDKNGSNKISLNINATEVELCGSKSASTTQQTAATAAPAPQTNGPADDLPF